jgi:hypothetical protein
LETPIWLTLMEYSAKYRVSLSTLRRRIKTGEIECKFTGGKYLLKDGPLELTEAAPETIAPPPKVKSQSAAPAPQPVTPTVPQQSASANQHMETTQVLLNEIKKAYSLILQEKEEQILQLKEEVADLKTLVRVLESENTRLNDMQPRLDFDLGLEA